MTDYATLKPKTNLPIVFTQIDKVQYWPNKEQGQEDSKKKDWPHQICLLGLIGGTAQRVFLAEWLAERLTEAGVIESTGDNAWAPVNGGACTLLREEDGTKKVWTITGATGGTPVASQPAGTGTQAPPDRSTDRARVKAIRDTYAAAWKMAGEIMNEGVSKPDVGEPIGHPDQHAAAATLFIHMSRRDDTMVWKN